MSKPIGLRGRRFSLKPAARIPPGEIASISPWWLFAGLAFLLFCAFMPGLGVDLKYHWASSGLLAFSGCILASRLPRTWALPGLMIWFAVLGTLTLLALWHSGLSDGFTLAGLFPYSDAAGYFSDAQRILAGEPITSFSSRRPMYAAFLAGLLKLTGNNLRLALAVQTLLVSCSIGCLTWAMFRRTRRVSNAAVFGMIMWVFFRRFVGTTTTENLGLLLGSLGFLAIWEALHEGSVRSFVLGVFLTGLALNTRAGAFFVLPALLVWGAMHFARPGQQFCWRTMGLGGTALILSFATNYGVLILSGGRPGLAFSNFSYTLYGLVNGGNWQLALSQHPELSLLEPGRQASSIFHLALGQIQAHPLSLVEGTLRAWINFLPRAFLFADSPPHAWAPSALASRLFALLALRGLYIAWQSRSTAASRLLFAVLLGIFLSVPFAPPWDSDYMRIFAATIPVLGWLASTGAQMGALNREIESPPGRHSAFTGLAVAGSCLLLSLMLPHFHWAIRGARALQVLPGTVIRVDPGPAPANATTLKVNPGLLKSWGMLLRERRLPPLSVDQLLERAHPGIAPEGIQSFLRTLPRENLTLALATGNAWPTTTNYDTNLIVVQGSGTWTFDARGPIYMGAVSPSPLP